MKEYSLKDSNSSELSSKEQSQLHKILKLIKYAFKKNEIEKKRQKEHEDMTIEWKEVARRLEYVFLLVAFITITITPIALFGKYFVKNENNQIVKRCGCEHSFIKSV